MRVCQRLKNNYKKKLAFLLGYVIDKTLIKGRFALLWRKCLF